MNNITILFLAVCCVGLISIFLIPARQRIYALVILVASFFGFLAITKNGDVFESKLETPAPTNAAIVISTSTPQPTPVYIPVYTPTPTPTPQPAPAAVLTVPRDQMYWENYDNTKVTAVQISATNYLDGAEQRRQEMLNAGFDSFIYVRDGKYRIMCGKFRNFSDAEKYRDLIIAQTDEDDAYLTNAYLSDDVIDRFEVWYYYR